MSHDAIAEQAGASGAADVTGEPAAPQSPALRIRTWLSGAIWFWPTVVTAVLVLWRLGGPVLWQDELVTLDVARRPLGQIVGLVQQVDAVHGAYYFFMHFWILIFGEAASALRLPSALAMAGAAGCVALIGRRLYSPRAGLAAGLAFAMFPAVSRFGQEARSYALVVLAAALATLMLLRAVERPTVARWSGYGVSLAVCLTLNAVAGAIIVGHLAGLLVLLGLRAWRPVISFGASIVLAGAIAFPVLNLGMGQAGRQVMWIPHGALFEAWQTALASVEVGYAVVVLALVAWLRPSRATAFATVGVVLPLLVIWLYSLGDINYFFSKYLLFTLPLAAVLVGAGLTAIRWRPAPVVGLVTLALLGLPDHAAVRSDVSHSWYTYPLARPNTTDLDYRAAAELVADGYQPGDGIVYQRGGNWWRLIDVGVRHYLPDSVQPRDIFLQVTAADDHELRAVECGAECLGDEERLWVVVAGRQENVLDQLEPSQALPLQAAYTQTQLTPLPGLTVGLLERRS